MSEKQTLNLDQIDELFPGKTIPFGNQSVRIKPLALEQIAIISNRLKDIIKLMNEEGITWDNYDEPENAFNLATQLVVQFPDVLEEVSYIQKETLVKLPIMDALVPIILAIVEVNIKSKDALMGNLKSLIKMWTSPKKDEKITKSKIKKKQKLRK